MKEKLRRLTALILAMCMSLSLLSANVWAVELEADEDASVAAQSEQEEHVHEDEEAPAAQEESADEELPAETESGEQQEESAQPETQESGEEAAESEAEPDAEPEQPEAEAGEEVLLPGYEEVYKPKGYENMNPEEALDAYVQEELSAQDDSTPRAARAKLDAVNQAAYDVLATKIAQVADGTQANTQFSVPVTELGLSQTSWTADELGVPENRWVENGELTKEAGQALDKAVGLNLEAISNALLADEPFRLYWYDKTKGVAFAYPGLTLSSYGNGQQSLGLDASGSFVFSFTVAGAYAGTGEYTTNASNCAAVSTAAATAAGIVEQYASASDYDKLNGYREKICELTDYNYDAANDDSTPYGNPWQCVWVFDGVASTTVVCEGYSKAFQHLCDNSTFNSSQIRCLSVSGTMAGGTGAGRHMWNVVRMEDGANYLVDVTNCDAGSVGAPDQLFLRGAQGSVAGGYTVSANNVNIEYQYDAENQTTLGEEAVTLSATDYEPTTGGGTGGVTYTGPVWWWSEDCSSATASFQPSDGSDSVVENARIGKVTTEATCVAAGSDVYTATVRFNGKSYTDTKTVEIPANPDNHVNTELQNQKDATCTEAGYTGDLYCKDCDTLVSGGSVIDAKGHAWGAPTYEWNAGHTEVTAKRVCANDPQHVETETVAVKTAEVTRKATCTSMGLHTYTSNAFKNPAFLVQTLTLADIEKDSNSHAGGTVVKNQKAATCGAAGYTGDTYCKGCSRKLSSGKAIPATGNHSWNGGVVTTAPSYTAAGVRTYTCNVCHAQKTESIPMLVLPGTKLSKVTVKKLTATVTWKKNTKGNGYQIQYSTDKKFKKGVKTVNIKKNKTVKATIKKLKKGKTYYFRIRTMKDGAFSAWSGAKKVKAK